MQQFIACCVSCVMILSIIRPATAQPSPLQNGATWYQRAIDRLPTITDNDWEAFWAWQEHPRGTPPPRLREVLAKAQPILNDFRRGAQQDASIHPLDYSQGVAMLLPHLAPMRSIARLMQADVNLALHDGDSARAAQSIGAMYLAGEQLKSDRTVISTLVGMAIFSLADKTAQDGFDRAAFNSNDADILYETLVQIDERDPFGSIEAIMMEQSMIVEWMTENASGPDQRQNLLDLFSITDEGVQTERAQQLLELDEDEFAQEIAQYDHMMDQMVEAFLIEDPDLAKEMLKEIDDTFDRGEAGLLASLITPALSKMYERLEMVRKQLADRKAMLDELRTGRAQPLDQANAAIYYEAAIASLRKLKPNELDLLVAYAAQPEETNESLRTAMKNAGEALDALHTASRIVRCDFRFGDKYRGVELCPAYVAGMHDALRVLQASAILAMREAETDAALDRLAMLCRAVSHLAGDQTMMSARVSHQAFTQTQILIRDAIERDLVTDDRKLQYFEAIDRIQRSDPFGYIGASTTAREWLTTHFHGLAVMTLLSEQPKNAEATAQLAEEAAVRVKKVISAWTADDIFLALAVFDAIERAQRKRAFAEEANGETAVRRILPVAGPDQPIAVDALDRVADLISAETLERLREQESELEPLFLRGEPEVISRIPLPPLADFSRNMDRARSDLRDGLRLVRPDEAEVEVEATGGE